MGLYTYLYGGMGKTHFKRFNMILVFSEFEF